jgi:hypothetical protein
MDEQSFGCSMYKVHCQHAGHPLEPIQTGVVAEDNNSLNLVGHSIWKWDAAKHVE